MPRNRGARRVCRVCLISLVFFLVASRSQIRSLRIACWVLRDEKSAEHLEASVAISQGWGKGCDSLTFIDTLTSDIEADWDEGYHKLSSKSFRAWHYIFEKYSAADFYLKADLDTLIFHEQLRAYLSRFSAHEPHYIGKHFMNGDHVSFVPGATIILSRAALLEFVGASVHNHSQCARHEFIRKGPAEDLALGSCLNEIGIYPHNTRDRYGRERFMVFSPEFMQRGLNGTLPQWYLQFSFNTEIGRNCCSDSAISFHQVHHSDVVAQVDIFARMSRSLSA